MRENKIVREKLTQQKHKMKRTKTLFKLGVPSWLVTIIGVVLVTGALIGLLWNTYYVSVEGDIDVNGNIQEEVALYYDGVQLIGDHLDITTMDYDELNPGDAFTVVHTFDNVGSKAYEVTVDLSGMPLEYVDPLDLWFGLTIKVFEHGTTTPLSSFQVMPLSDYEFDIFYSVNALFEEPVIAFPFLMTLDIEVVNMPPVAVDDSLSITYGQTKSVYVLTNDYDPEGEPLTITWVETPVGGISSVIVGDHIDVTNNHAAPLSGIIHYKISDGVNEVTGNINFVATLS